MQSENFDLEILNLDHAKLKVNYYLYNKEHLAVWHSTTPDGFYTLEYQKNKIKEFVELMKDKKSMHFIILNKYKNKMIGHCNYTKIKNIKCWLGYSIARDYEGKNFMYEALLLTNSYMFSKLNIEEIRAGILPTNERSIRLIKKLHFKYIGKKDELEMNGEIKTYDTYIQQMIKESNIYVKK